MNIVELMAAPFVECLVLVAIHTYLGIHVLRRRVIFVDLALAQIAALGTTVGFLFGIMPETPGALLFSIAFTVVGAAVFSITRFRHERVPQEAIIGLTYAICCAAAVLVVEKTKGAEHLKDILVGNLLWVTWADVASATVAYSLVGIVHFLSRRQFLLISEDPDAAFKAGMRVRLWDFAFYLTFGVVIAFSTRVAGVLLVFVFLVAPGILAFLVTSRLWLQLVIGWSTGTVVTVIGLYLSWKLDLPSGPAVISLYGVVLAIGAIAVYVWRAEKRRHATCQVALGLSSTCIVILGFWVSGRWLGESSMSVSNEARVVAAAVLSEQAAADRVEAGAAATRRNELAARVAGCVGTNKLERYLLMAGPEERLAQAKQKLAESPRRGLEFLLLALADHELPLLYREEGVELLGAIDKEAFGYDPTLEPPQNSAAIRRICDHIRAMKKVSSNQGASND